ncbi:MAG: LPS export ABC transporter periplasmic protein LptC [Telluria sp.]
MVTNIRNKRTAHRGPLLALMLAGVFAAFGSFWLMQVMQGEQSGPNVNLGNEPDYIIDNFSFVRMTETGRPQYVISGERLTHHPADNTSDIDKPVVQSMTVEHPRTTMTAERAHVDQNKSQIDLAGNVDMQRPGAPARPGVAASQPMRIRTEAMTLLTDDEIAKTDKPSRLTPGGATVDAVGMVANNATEQIDLGGPGRAIYPPRQQH